LGDGSLDRLGRKYPRFGMTQALRHIDWLYLTQAIFTKKNIDAKVGSNAKGCYLWTPQCRQLAEFRLEFYPDEATRTVPSDIWLTPITTLFWYIDDGSLTWGRDKCSQVNFASCSFSKDENELLSNRLLKDVGIRSSVVPNGEYYRINLLGGKEGLKLFFDFINIPGLIPESYRHKFRGFLF